MTTLEVNAKQATISLKRYNAIKELIFTKCNKEDAEFLCKKICEIINFNPDVKPPSKSKNVMEWRKKKAQEYGVSVSTIMKGVKKLKLPEK
jgi:hypothetical protein